MQFGPKDSIYTEGYQDAIRIGEGTGLKIRTEGVLTTGQWIKNSDPDSSYWKVDGTTTVEGRLDVEGQLKTLVLSAEGNGIANIEGGNFGKLNAKGENALINANIKEDGTPGIKR